MQRNLRVKFVSHVKKTWVKIFALQIRNILGFSHIFDSWVAIVKKPSFLNKKPNENELVWNFGPLKAVAEYECCLTLEEILSARNQENLTHKLLLFRTKPIPCAYL